MANHNRGDVWIVDLGFAAKVRPAAVLSISIQDEDWSLVTLVPHTTSPRDTRFEVSIRARFLKKGVFNCQSLVTIPTAKLIRKIGLLTAEQMSAIEDAVRFWLQL